MVKTQERRLVASPVERPEVAKHAHEDVAGEIFWIVDPLRPEEPGDCRGHRRVDALQRPRSASPSRDHRTFEIAVDAVPSLNGHVPPSHLTSRHEAWYPPSAPTCERTLEPPRHEP